MWMMHSKMEPEVKMQMKASEVSDIKKELGAIRRNRISTAVLYLPVFGLLYGIARSGENAIVMQNQSNQMYNAAANIVYTDMQNGNSSVISAVHAITGNADAINITAMSSNTNAHTLAYAAVSNGMQFWSMFGPPQPGNNAITIGWFPTLQTITAPVPSAYSELFKVAGNYIIAAQSTASLSQDWILASCAIGIATLGYVYLYVKSLREIKKDSPLAFSAERAKSIRRTLRAIKRGEIEVVE